MELNHRQQQILATIRAESEVQIDHLADKFAVTTQTIRRDVNHLCEQGLARRVHGGVSLPATMTNTSYRYRSEVESKTKGDLTANIAACIPDGATVMIGIGTTLAHLAQHLLSKASLRVITNNLQVAQILEANESIEIYLAGGQFRREHQDIMGSSAVDFFNSFEADIGICGCAGVTDSHHVMEHENIEADISKAIIRNSRQQWLVADASKWGQFAAMKVAPMKQFDKIFTNNTQLPTEFPVYLTNDNP
ncbi:DeoR/GlpR family DNA-binding transcription regulator [Photobacterium sp. ZSDE20]|uniref:DeoR/GlpR family DNA-binding transcription regulator n=1 Tax=Photobacterium pectinilyticum TaxID=2906793 RepID=A0ABT1MWL1_9GAMM|nr:DeoR/GlpR family DNA-binding transcription regulator [Photobacterium sp. ZSDE20]MCQ1056888.1 DeoR/GlpR family DNA-binding transcription regulator [Photobacterium sp. ZSDE20]MDD1821023.1 DeoR/GlpR family DNA-binding transcription regulator [Photobacterium sp. ZSDE20]